MSRNGRRLGPIIVTSCLQAGGAPIVDDGHCTDGDLRAYRCLVIRRPVASDRAAIAGRSRHLAALRTPNRLATPVNAVVIGWRGYPRPLDRARWIVHNAVAHPLLVLWPRLGGRLHDRTAPRDLRRPAELDEASTPMAASS